MRWTGLSGPPASQNAPARDVAAAEAAAAAEHQARYNLDREAEERHIRLRESRRPSGELLGIMSVANHSDLIDEFSSASGPLNGGSAHPGAGSAAAAAGGGPASPGARRAGCFGDNGGASDDYDDTDAVADLEAGLGHGPRAGRAAGSVAAPAGDGGDADGHGHGHHGGNGRLLDPVPEAARLTLVFRDIKGFVPSGFSRPGPLKRAAGRVAHPKEGLRQQECQIMFGLSGEVRPGEVLALMGPSGSGKTTLLSVLGGRPAKALSVTGSLTVNGLPYTKAVRRRIGFVLQDDVLYEDLTVLETLRYAALLRLPRTMDRAEKEARVEAVVDVLGVRKSRNTIIGGFLRRGISGGERKRVSIGHELLINPAVLMLDEPTSGLDSTSALHLIDLLRDLAADGRAIVSTIHQPSSRLYTRLDSLMLLAEGHLLYAGNAQGVVAHFERFGLRVPFGTSIADFVLDAAMGEAGTTLSGNTGDAAVRELWDAFAASGPDGKWAQRGSGAAPPLQGAGGGAAGGDATATGHDQVSRRANGGAGGAKDAHRTATGDAARPAAGRDGGEAPREGAAYWEQVSVLVGRAIKVRRFEQLTGGHFFQLIFVAVIAGLVWWQRGSTYTRLNGVDVLGLLFFELLFPSFRSLFHALFTFPNEFRMLMKERPAGLYKLSAYYLARTIADVPIEVLNTVLFVLIAYWFGGLNRNAGDFFANLGTMILVVTVAEAWGLLVGGIFMQPKKAQTATTVIMLTFLLVGGYYARSIPVWISWLRYLSFLYWGFNILTKIQFRRYQLYDCGGAVTTSSSRGYTPDELAAIPACKPINDPQTALGLPAPPHAAAWPDALILIGMLIALRLAIYYTLRTKTRTRKLLMA